MLRHLLGLALLLLLVPGCPTDGDDDDSLAGTPDIHVTPASLEFEPLLAGHSATFPITIANTGDATLTVEDLDLQGDDGFAIDGGTERLVEPDASIQVDVTCAPTGDGPLVADLHVISDDPDTPDVAVELTCTGMAPVIEVDPVDIDFGDVPIGCVAEADVIVSNVGSLAFDLANVVFAPSSDEMFLSYYFQPGMMQPGISETITVHYEPRDELPDTGYLTLSTNMPASATVTITAVGNGVLGDEVTDTFVANGNRSDILWVVNDTASMADNVGSLAVNLGGFLDIIQVLDFDWQMGVITSSEPWLHGEAAFITPATVDAHAVFADALAIPLTGTEETGLAASVEALTPPLTDPGGPNDGFLRTTAALRVIYVDDEDDQSPDPVADYVAALQGLKADPTQVQLAAIIDPTQSTRWAQAVTATGGLIGQINGPNWVDLMSDLAWFCLSDAGTYELSQAPVLETLTVWVEGAPLFVGWYYDAVLNAVVFDPDYLPDEGDTITIVYNELLGC